MHKKEYKIFGSEEGDWYVAALKVGDEVTSLYEGHSKSQAFEAILGNLYPEFSPETITGEEVEAEMQDTGTFSPTLEKWNHGKQG